MLSTVARAIWPTWGDGEIPPLSVGRAEPRTSGTLGGYLSSPTTGCKYLVSCAHVFGPPGPEVYTPGPFENKNSTPIAVTRFREIPPPKLPGEECNLLAMPNAGRLNLSVAEWLPSMNGTRHPTPIPTVNLMRRTAKMSSYQMVTFVGKESGFVQAQLSGVTLWYEIDFMDFGEGPPSTRCFGTIFEMSDLSGDRSVLARPGDSGAWVFDNMGDMRCWNGMLIGRQGKRAYGCYAEFIMNALANIPAIPGGLAIRW